MRGLQPWESAHDSVTYRPDIGIAAALQGLGIAYHFEEKRWASFWPRAAGASPWRLLDPAARVVSLSPESQHRAVT